MVKKILKILTNNIGFKLLAVGFAFVLWLVVYNIDDPTIRKTFTVSVNIENADAVMNNMNKYYEVLDGTNNVTFAVTAKRSVMDKLEDNDFTATADMSRIVVDEETQTGTVAIELTCNRYSSSVQINGGSKYLRVSLEDLMSKQFVITPSATGTPAEGYALGNITVSPNVLTVSGPASLVSQISTVVATIGVEGMYVDLTDSVVPQLFDADGNEMDTTKLRLSRTTVDITARILSTKEVSLNFSTRGAPAANYTVTGINCTPEKIWIKGAANVLNPIVAIDVPGNVLNISGASEDVTTTIDITEYLPEGVELADSSNAMITVVVSIREYATQSFSVPTANISVEGLDDNYDITFLREGTASISAVEGDLALLVPSQLMGTIDVSGLSEGTHTVTIKLYLDENRYAVGTAEVTITLTRKEEENTDNNGNASTGDNDEAEGGNANE